MDFSSASRGFPDPFGDRPRPWLAPLALLYSAAARAHRAWMLLRFRGLRQASGQPVPRLPLVVVGALRAGGSGKTSVAAEVAMRWRRKGLRVAILAYRLGPGSGGDRDLEEVLPDSDWRRTSEEAVLLRRLTGARVFATRHRARAWRRLAEDGGDLGGPFDVAVSDDGFQDPRLSGAFQVLLRAPGESPGLFDLLPAGPWRETRAAAARADLVLEGPLPGASLGNSQDTEPGRSYPWFSRRLLLPEGFDPARPWAALCGLGDNRGFLEGLAGAGIRISAALRLPDHAAAAEARLEGLVRRAGAPGILCTRKDFLKLDPEAVRRHQVLPVDQEIRLSREAWAALDRHLAAHPFRRPGTAGSPPLPGSLPGRAENGNLVH